MHYAVKILLGTLALFVLAGVVDVVLSIRDKWRRDRAMHDRFDPHP
jgi:hypothetical protein